MRPSDWAAAPTARKGSGAPCAKPCARLRRRAIIDAATRAVTPSYDQLKRDIINHYKVKRAEWQASQGDSRAGVALSNPAAAANALDRERGDLKGGTHSRRCKEAKETDEANRTCAGAMLRYFMDGATYDDPRVDPINSSYIFERFKTGVAWDEVSDMLHSAEWMEVAAQLQGQACLGARCG